MVAASNLVSDPEPTTTRVPAGASRAIAVATAALLPEHSIATSTGAVASTAWWAVRTAACEPSGQRVGPEPAPRNEHGQRQQHGIDPDVHGLVAASVNHCRADYHEDQPDRSQRDKDRGDMRDCGQDQPSGAENLNHADQSNVRLSDVLSPTLAGADQLLLRDKEFYQPASGEACR